MLHAPTELASVEQMTDQLAATTNKNLSVARAPPPVGGGERETNRGERGDDVLADQSSLPPGRARRRREKDRGDDPNSEPTQQATHPHLSPGSSLASAEREGMKGPYQTRVAGANRRKIRIAETGVCARAASDGRRRLADCPQAAN
jgi:hypothetical protein